MIDQVKIKNFKSLRDVSINLKRFTVFVGANGSGKTSLLQALDLLCRTFQFPTPQSADSLLRSNRSVDCTEDVELRCRFDRDHFRYRTSQAESDVDQANWEDGPFFAFMSNPDVWNKWSFSYSVLPSPVWLRLDPSILLTPGKGDNPDPRIMDANGKGLHSATASINLEDPDLWSKLQDDLRRIVPSIKRLRHTPHNELLFDTINGRGLKAHQVSEGTLLTLGLLTAIHSIDKPGLLLLDDLDRALHPKAQWELISLLRGILETNPELQIVATTHSPYLLDKMEPEEVRVLLLSDDGYTACEELTSHPKYSKWKDEFYPGEMWSAFGEDWVAKSGSAE
jgi:predicted ATPase